MYRKNKNKNTGFTLIEMLVSIGVFMSVMVVAVSALVSIINVNKKTQQIKSVVDNITFVIDSIARNARIGTNYSCNLGSGSHGDCGPSKTFEYMKNDGTYTQYRFVPSNDPSLAAGVGNIQRKDGCTDANGSCGLNQWQSMTAPTSTVNITNVNFYVFGIDDQSLPTLPSTPSGRTQPRVIITAEGDIIGSDGKKTSFNLQTTASQRSRQSSN